MPSPSLSFREQRCVQNCLCCRTPKSVAALTALIDKIAEPVIIQSWSSSGLLGYLTERVKGILAVETSITAFDMISAEGRQKLAKIPIYIVIGDHAQDRVDASRKSRMTWRRSAAMSLSTRYRRPAYMATATR